MTKVDLNGKHFDVEAENIEIVDGRIIADGEDVTDTAPVIHSEALPESAITGESAVPIGPDKNVKKQFN